MSVSEKLFNKNNRIDMEDINYLLENKTIEDIYLEYKTPVVDNQELKFNDKEKHKLLKEISGFSNAEGGLLIYGIKEDENRYPSELYGVKINSNPDELSNQITSIISSQLDPILKPFPEIRFLHIHDNEYIILIRIFKGLNRPYRSLLGKKEYYIRRGNKTEPMDSYEIKQYINNDNGESKRLLSENHQPLLNLHTILSGIYYARCNIVNMFNTVRGTYNQEKYYGYIINSREKLFNYLYGLIRNIKEFYYIPSDLKEYINQYVDYCEKEYNNWGKGSKKIHYRTEKDLTFKYVENIFYLTEKYADAKIKKNKNRPSIAPIAY